MTDKMFFTVGYRDDLNMDVSRCLRMRYGESRCSHCIDICPHGAVTLENGLTITAELCHGCLLCTTVCPSGALEPQYDFRPVLALLSRSPEAVLGCSGTKELSNATLPCLGGLSEEHLFTLCHSMTGKLTLNLSHCSDCPNGSITTYLLQRLAALSASALLENGCAIGMAESTAEIHYSDESVNRRNFFKSFRNSIFKQATDILSTTKQQTQRRTEYAGKRVPNRRALLNSMRDGLTQELKIRLQNHFDRNAHFEDRCTGCQACAAICPSGALKAEHPETAPAFEQALCTGCGLCEEFCSEGALSRT